MVKVGTKFRSLYMNSNPLWVVTRKAGRGVWLAKVVESDDYCGEVKAFRTAEIERSLDADRMWTLLAHEAEQFWAAVEVGCVLHYDDGFGAFVRCVVVEGPVGRMLKPLALVGNWRAYDLPHVGRNGEVHYPYHAKKIRDGGPAWRPSIGCIWEASERLRGRYLDPAKLPAIDLTGTMTHERDEDCTVGPDGCCIECGVSHTYECHVCGRHGFHRDGCPESEEAT